MDSATVGNPVGAVRGEEVKRPESRGRDSGEDKQEKNYEKFLLRKEVTEQICHEGNLPFVAAGGASLFGGVDLFAMGFHFAKSINGFVLRFVIGARHNFAKQAHGNELDTANQKRDREHHQWAVLLHYGHVVVQLLKKYVRPDQ